MIVRMGQLTICIVLLMAITGAAVLEGDVGVLGAWYWETWTDVLIFPDPQERGLSFGSRWYGQLGLFTDLRSDFMVMLPAEWGWRGFSGNALMGGMNLGADLLLSGFKRQYTQIYATGDFGDLRLDLRYASLGDGAHGGPSRGAVFSLVWPFCCEIEVRSTTEFGATTTPPGQAVTFGHGISFVDERTERSRHYETDPRSSGGWITGQRLSVVLPFLVTPSLNRLEIGAYFTDGGFHELLLGVGETQIRARWVDGSLTLRQAPGSEIRVGFTIGLAPDFPLGLNALLYTGDQALLGGLGGHIYLGPFFSPFFSLSYVQLIEHESMVVATEAYGGGVMAKDRAIFDGFAYYEDYDRFLTISYNHKDPTKRDTPGFWARLFYEKGTPGIVRWSSFSVDSLIDLGDLLSVSFRIVLTRSGLERLRVGVVARPFELMKHGFADSAEGAG